MSTQQRSPEEIRASIELHRRELAVSVRHLHGEVERLTDWRTQVRTHRTAVIAGAAVAGFVLGGGIAALGGALFRRRR
jgi:hypothetical protein